MQQHGRFTYLNFSCHDDRFYIARYEYGQRLYGFLFNVIRWGHEDINIVIHTAACFGVVRQPDNLRAIRMLFGIDMQRFVRAVYNLQMFYHTKKHASARPVEALSIMMDVTAEAQAPGWKVRLHAFQAEYKQRLDRLIEYATRPDSEWTQKLLARQMRGLDGDKK